MDWPASDASVYAMIPFRKLRRSVSTENGGISRDYNADTTPIRIGVSRMSRISPTVNEYHVDGLPLVFTGFRVNGPLRLSRYILYQSCSNELRCIGQAVQTTRLT